MHRFLLILALVACLPLRADILANSDFSQGKAHWGGDVHDLDSDSSSLLSGAPPKGVIIHLDKDKWRIVYQTFTVRTDSLYYSITLKLSPDYRIADARTRNVVPIDLSNTPDGRTDADSDYNDVWRLFMRSPGPSYAASYKRLTPPDPAISSAQTLTGKMDQMPRDTETVLYLAIPPGEGSVTLLNCSLSADKPATSGSSP